MATVKKMKKAEDGYNLKTRQYKRLGRIAEKNPDRADRVAGRMNEKASRVSRGKEIAKQESPMFSPSLKNSMKMENRMRDMDLESKDKMRMSKEKEMKMGGKMAKQAAVAIAMKKAGKTPKKKMNYGGAAASMKPTSMMKKGGSFPDLNKDGKITKADILKGRGVIAKSGTKMKKGGKMKMGGKCKNGC
jgi:hypothetical protein